MENKKSILCLICLIISSSVTPIFGSNSDGHQMNNTASATNTGGTGMHKSMTHMTFFWGKNSEILFTGWPGTRAGMYVLVLIIVFVLAIIVEWLSHSRLTTEAGQRSFSVGMIQTAVNGLRVTIAYIVMLAVMSFNGGVFIVAVVGHSLGYLVFRSRVLNSNNNNQDLIPSRIPK